MGDFLIIYILEINNDSNSRKIFENTFLFAFALTPQSFKEIKVISSLLEPILKKKNLP